MKRRQRKQNRNIYVIILLLLLIFGLVFFLRASGGISKIAGLGSPLQIGVFYPTVSTSKKNTTPTPKPGGSKPAPTQISSATPTPRTSIPTPTTTPSFLLDPVCQSIIEPAFDAGTCGTIGTYAVAKQNDGSCCVVSGFTKNKNPKSKCCPGIVTHQYPDISEGSCQLSHTFCYPSNETLPPQATVVPPYQDPRNNAGKK